MFFALAYFCTSVKILIVNKTSRKVIPNGEFFKPKLNNRAESTMISSESEGFLVYQRELNRVLSRPSAVRQKDDFFCL